MNRKGLIKEVSRRSGLTQVACERVIGAMMDVIIDELRSGGRVVLQGFGVFKRVYRPGRKIDNDIVGSVEIPSGFYPSFKAGRNFKEKINYGNKNLPAS